MNILFVYVCAHLPNLCLHTVIWAVQEPLSTWIHYNFFHVKGQKIGAKIKRKTTEKHQIRPGLRDHVMASQNELVMIYSLAQF